MSIAIPILILCFITKFKIVFLRIGLARLNKVSYVTDLSSQVSRYFNVSFILSSRRKRGYSSTTSNDNSILISGVVFRPFIMFTNYLLIDAGLLALLILGDNLIKLMSSVTVPLFNVTDLPDTFFICLPILVAGKNVQDGDPLAT